ncbi:hypothetical protein D3C87_1624270 [compost metagenome]
MRIPLKMRLGQTDYIGQPFNSRPPLLRIPCAMHNHRLFQDTLHGIPRVEGRERVLENNLHLPPLPAHVLHRQLRDLPAFKPDFPRRRLDQTKQ